MRIGNAAWCRLQIDVFGSVMDTLHEAAGLGLDPHEASRPFERELLKHPGTFWQQPDVGLRELSEPYDLKNGVFAGNFPRAFSRLELIDTAFDFAGVKGSAREALQD